jgi:hypothetical protein
LVKVTPWTKWSSFVGVSPYARKVACVPESVSQMAAMEDAVSKVQLV